MRIKVRSCSGFRFFKDEDLFLSRFTQRDKELYVKICEIIAKTDGYFVSYEKCAIMIFDELGIKRPDFELRIKKIFHMFDTEMLKKFNILTSKYRQKSFLFFTSNRKCVEIVKDYCLVDFNESFRRPRSVVFIEPSKHEIKLKRVRKTDSRVIREYIDERVKTGAVKNRFTYRRALYRSYKKCAYSFLKSARAFLKRVYRKIARSMPACPKEQLRLDSIFYKNLDIIESHSKPPESSFFEKMKRAATDLKLEGKRFF